MVEVAALFRSLYARIPAFDAQPGEQYTAERFRVWSKNTHRQGWALQVFNRAHSPDKVSSVTPASTSPNTPGCAGTSVTPEAVIIDVSGWRSANRRSCSSASASRSADTSAECVRTTSISASRSSRAAQRHWRQ